jgi:NhaP-type Na+/H+ or K+/H+ antiporter
MLNNIRYKRRFIIYFISIIGIISGYILAWFKSDIGEIESIVPYVFFLFIWFTLYISEMFSKKFKAWLNKKEKLYSEMSVIEKRKYKIKKLKLL